MVEHELWMLLNMPASEPAVMLGFTTDGTVEHTLVFPAVRETLSFAFDGAEDRVYFTLPSTARVVATLLPDGWR